MIVTFVVLALLKPWGGAPSTDGIAPSAAEASGPVSAARSPSAAPSAPARAVSADRACSDLQAVESAESAESAGSPGSTSAGRGGRPFVRPPRVRSLIALRADASGRYDLAGVPASAPDMPTSGISRLTDWQLPGPPLATLLSSPDGRSVALTFFGSAECTEPLVVRSDGGVVAPFAATTGRPVVPVGWAPSGRLLAAIVGDLGLAIWDESSGSVTVPGVPCFACGAVASAAWSRDGSRIAVLYSRPCPARDGCDWFGLATFSVGTERAAPFAGWEVQDPRWLDEVQHGERAGILGWVGVDHVALALGTRVAVVPIDPTAAGRFVALRTEEPVLSPDGRSLAWVAREGTRVTELEVADVASGHSSRVWSAPAGRDLGATAVIAWSPDSRRLAIGLRDEIWIGGSAGGFVRVPGAALPVAALTW